MSFIFDGSNKLIILDTGVVTFTASEIYSRWKDWVLLSDNSKYEFAFSSVAGDPISSTQVISPYIFLNTTAGWRIRPDETDHQLSIDGNLYSVDPNLNLFVSTVGDFTVTIVINRSAASITTTVSGTALDESTVINALNTQGYTTIRSNKLDNLNASVSSISGTGLSDAQATMLLEMYKLFGLDPTKPLIVTSTTRKVPANGSDINQTITENGTEITVQRV